jgi:hypothetical protein
MNNSLIDGLLGQLQGAPTEQIAQQLNTDPETAQNAISAALPLIMGALGQNTQQPEGASALFQALEKDHSGQDSLDLGSLLGALTGGQGQGGLGGLLGGLLGSGGAQSALGGMLGGGVKSLLGTLLGGGDKATPQLNAGGILGHIFGSAQSHAQDGLGKATGLGAEKAGGLLMILAPIVMSYLARQTQTNKLDAGGLGTLLGQEQSALKNQGDLIGGLLGSILGRK